VINKGTRFPSCLKEAVVVLYFTFRRSAKNRPKPTVGAAFGRDKKALKRRFRA